MNNRLAAMLYYFNKLLLFIAVGGMLFSIVMMIIEYTRWYMWFTFLLFTIVVYGAVKIFSMMRQSRYPFLNKNGKII